MRILIVSHYFPPETGAPQARLSALAAAWAGGGDEVTVLTGMPNHPTGVLPPEYRRAIRRRERRDGYAVVRTWLYATPNEGIARKTLSHLSFMVTSVLLGLAGQRPGRHRGGVLPHVLLHRLGLAAGQAQAGPARRRGPRPVAGHLRRARRAHQPPGHRGCWSGWNWPPTPPPTRWWWSATGSGATSSAAACPPPRCTPSATASPSDRVRPGAPRPTRTCGPGSAPGPASAWSCTPGTHGISQGLPEAAEAADPADRPARAPGLRRRRRRQAAAAAPGRRSWAWPTSPWPTPSRRN